MLGRQLGRRFALDTRSRAALAGILESPRFELVPLKHALDHAGALPPGAVVPVTASPARGIDATIDLAEQLQGRGFAAVPHLAARMVRDRAHLRELMARLAGAGIDRAFVIGGDATEPGDFPDGLSLLREMADLGHHFSEIGIPCYPGGHAFIPDDRLAGALAAKAPFASYMTTQLCFDPAAVAAWLRARRADGIRLPVHLGVPGAAEIHRLLAISARIGVRDSRRFLAKNTSLVRRLLRPGGYRPDGLLEGLVPLIADPLADIRAIHLYTFNQVESTEAWRRRYLERLGAAGVRPRAMRTMTR
jgi:methylenetetrahydrofolate reductase (NADPH)